MKPAEMLMETFNDLNGLIVNQPVALFKI